MLTVISEVVSQALDKKCDDLASVFDISKACDRVLHAGLLRNLKGNSVSDRIFDFNPIILSSRIIKVILNGHASSTFHINYYT